jgi:hypothetical protein
MTGTTFAHSTDGTQIAFDLTGTGPAILLLHGGDGRRKDWHERGYVGRLQEGFAVITQVHIVEGLDHDQAFDEIDKVLPTMLALTYE